MYSRVYVEITNVCNKSCSFCPKTNRAPKLMSEKEFDTVTDRLIGVTEYIYYHLMGEPTAHPQLAKFIKIAKAKGFKSAVTTNGSLLNKTGDTLIQSGAYKVNISLHSFENGSLDEHKSYISECLSFADKASSSGVLVVLRLWNGGAQTVYNELTESLIRDRFGNPESTSARGMRLKNKLHLEYADRFSWPDKGENELGERVFCHGLGDHFGVLCDGTVVPCCLDHEGDIPLGNIFEQDIRDILSCRRARAIKEGFEQKIASEQLCRKCGYARRFKI